MRDDSRLREISKVVLETLRNDFYNLKIRDVKVHNDLDFDGDDILRIEVIFEGLPKNVDTSMLSGAVRHIRPKLAEMDEMAFPLLSFISDRELKNTGSGLAPA
jgi:hypothetical protein